MHTHNAEAINFFIVFSSYLNNEFEVCPQCDKYRNADNFNYIVFDANCFTNIAFGYANIATVAKMLKIFLIHCANCQKMLSRRTIFIFPQKRKAADAAFRSIII